MIFTVVYDTKATRRNRQARRSKEFATLKEAQAWAAQLERKEGESIGARYYQEKEGGFGVKGAGTAPYKTWRMPK